ncbi:MAG: hypothetical protein J5634_00920 [Bacilli bacterium]|nr:hypothetical protein [Bacilli bacterium]
MKMKSKVATSQYSEDWLPVKKIMNGMISTDDGYFVTGVKVLPKNIFMLEKTEQQRIIYDLRNFYNSLDYEFWLIIADRPVDINVYLANLQIQYNNTHDSFSRKLIMQDINKANDFMSAEYNVVDTEYFILFKEKKSEIVQKRLHALISGFASCGLSASQTSNDDLRMLLDNFFNGGNKTTLGTVSA